MKASEFAYWLQGYFEIQGGAEALTATQAQKIYDRTQKIAPAQTDVDAKAQSFVSFAQGVLLMATQNAGDANTLKFVTDTLRTKLNDTFIHAIDPSYAGDQTHFQHTHDGGPVLPPRQPGMRC